MSTHAAWLSTYSRVDWQVGRWWVHSLNSKVRIVKMSGHFTSPCTECVSEFLKLLKAKSRLVNRSVRMDGTTSCPSTPIPQHFLPSSNKVDTLDGARLVRRTNPAPLPGPFTAAKANPSCQMLGLIWGEVFHLGFGAISSKQWPVMLRWRTAKGACGYWLEVDWPLRKSFVIWLC